PPAHSSEEHLNPQNFSPESRTIRVPHSAAIGEEEIVDDWPICLYIPTGQDYMLFHADVESVALFEDNWLKSQPLETLFSSIRQSLENELASLTNSFAMDE